MGAPYAIIALFHLFFLTLADARCVCSAKGVTMEQDATDDNATPGSRSLGTADPARDGTMKILAVDDDPFILELVPKITATIGFSRVTSAASAEEALQAIAQADAPFDCLLLDISMPGMSGIDLCAHVRNLDGYRTTPIIMLTAMSDSGHLDRAFEAGATDFSPKPFDVMDLADRLRTAEAQMSAERRSDRVQDEVAAFDPQSPGMIPGVDTLINYTTLVTYLTRRTERGHEPPAVFAVAVKHMDEILRITTASETVRVLARVAKAISDVLGIDKFFGSYAGGGCFVIVHSGGDPGLAEVIESRLRWYLKNIHQPDVTPVIRGLSVSVGSTVRETPSRSAGAQAIFEKVIKLAKFRCRTDLFPSVVQRVIQSGQ